MRVNAVIVAAGEGKRMGGGTSKPFLSVGGQPLIVRTLARFVESRTVQKIIVVAAQEEIARCENLVRSHPRLSGKEYLFQPGGARRQDSVSQGLMRLDADCEVVVIHDGARPLVSPSLIDRCVEAAWKDGAVVVGIPVRDTIKIVSSDRHIQETPARDSLWEIQTPQVFRAEIIREAYSRAVREGTEATDDAMLVERLGRRVTLLEGDRTNIKITVPEDLVFVEVLLREGRVP